MIPRRQSAQSNACLAYTSMMLDAWTHRDLADHLNAGRRVALSNGAPEDVDAAHQAGMAKARALLAHHMASGGINRVAYAVGLITKTPAEADQAARDRWNTDQI